MKDDVENRTIVIRGDRVILDCDMAELLGIKTGRLNEQIRRNLDLFPEGSLFELTQHEKQEVIANCDNLSKMRFSPHSPLALTEKSIVILPIILRTAHSQKAISAIIGSFFAETSEKTPRETIDF